MNPEHNSISIGTADDLTAFDVAQRHLRANKLGTSNEVRIDASRGGAPREGTAEYVHAELVTKSKTSEELLAQPLPRWLVRGLILEGQVGILVGKWKLGKTMVAIHQAYCLKNALPFYTSPDGTKWGEVARPCSVLYIAGEGASALRGRADAYERTYPQPKDCPHKIFWFPESLRLLEPDALEGLITFCRANKVGFIFVDTLASAIKDGGNAENDSALMTKLVEGLGRVCQAVQGAGEFICHPIKDKKDKSTSTDARGSGGIEASARFKMAIELDGTNRLWSLVVNNEIPDNPTKVCYEIRNVEIGTNPDGDMMNAGCFVAGKVREAKDRKPSQNQQACFAIKQNLDEQGHFTPAVLREQLSEIGIKSSGSILSRLLASGFVERVVEAKGKYKLTAKGDANASLTLGNSHLPLSERKTSA